MTASDTTLDLSRYKLGWSDEEDYVFKPKRGLNEDILQEMSWMKGEPDWMRNFRLKSYNHFTKRPMPNWGGDMSGIDFDNIYYYIKPTDHQVDAWDELPDSVKDTYEKLGIPEAERKYLAGVTAQYESEVVYHRNREDLERQGVIFTDMDTALREHPEIVKAYFGKVIPPNDNKFSALNSSVWSGGSFIYVPPGVEVEMPLQAYFRINAENMGQFERTLIIADEGSQVHYIEGCSAPVYTTDSLHSAVVEIIVKPSARVTYTTIQNWSNNVYNLVTKRARVEAEGHMEWIDGNIGSPPDHEVPGRLHGRPQGLRRGAVGGLRRPRPAPGRRRQDGPRRPRDHVQDRLQVDLQGRRAHVVPRPGAGRGRRLRLQEPRAVRRPDPRRRVGLGHLPLHGGRGRATPSSATRPRCPRWPTSSSST